MSNPMDARDLIDRRCTARSKRSGQRCKRRPILGGSVCVMHGGKAPQVKLAAKDRLAMLVDPAIDALQGALDHKDINAAIRAAKDLLDRAGLAAPKQMQVGVEPGPSLLNITRSIERQKREECDLLHGGQCSGGHVHSRRMAALEQECVDRCQGTCATLVEHVEKMGGREGRPEEVDQERLRARQAVSDRWKRGRVEQV